MVFKKKCPSCGAKNSKERVTCMECGAPLDLENVRGQLARVSTSHEVEERKEVEEKVTILNLVQKEEESLEEPTVREEAPEEKVEDEYWGKEKVRYKTGVKLSQPDRNPQEVALLVTEGHVVIKAEQPIKIPLLRIKNWYASKETISLKETDFRPAWVTYIDETRKKRQLSFSIATRDVYSFEYDLRRAIEKAKEQWIESLPPEKNLFVRHLNWPVVLSWIIAFGILYYWGTSLAIVGLVIVLIVTGWALWKKNRSFFNLLWYLVPFPFVGLIIILCLQHEPKLGTLNYEVKDVGNR